MRGLVVEKNGIIHLADDIPMPEIGPYEALVKIECCMICNGTDMEIIKGGITEAQRFPLVLGHEGVGIVVRKGEKVCSYQIGDRVLRASLPDSEHYYSGWGSFCEYGVVKDSAAMLRDGYSFEEASGSLTQQVTAPDITPEQAALMITLKETCSALMRMGVERGDRVLVVGDGPVGLCMLSICRLLAIEADMVGNHRENLEIAKRIGAAGIYWNKDFEKMHHLREERKKYFDFYIDTVGTPQTIRQGLPLVREDGMVAVYGLRTGQELGIPLEGVRNVTLKFVQWPIPKEEMKTHALVEQGIREKKINTEFLISHRMELKDFEKGFQAIREKRALKVVLFMENNA